MPEAHSISILLAILVEVVPGCNVERGGGEVDRELHVVNTAREMQLVDGRQSITCIQISNPSHASRSAIEQERFTG